MHLQVHIPETKRDDSAERLVLLACSCAEAASWYGALAAATTASAPCAPSPSSAHLQPARTLTLRSQDKCALCKQPLMERQLRAKRIMHAGLQHGIIRQLYIVAPS